MSDELYPLGHEADETMYSSGDVRQLLADHAAENYARGFAAGLEQAAGVCDERAEASGKTRASDGHDELEARECAAAIRALAAPPAAGDGK